MSTIKKENVQDALRKDMEVFLRKLCPLDEKGEELPLDKDYLDCVQPGVDNLSVVIMVVERKGNEPVVLRQMGRAGIRDRLLMQENIFD